MRFLSLCLAVLTLLPLVAQSGPISLTKRERDQLKKETVYAIDLIQRYHYKQKSFADVDSAELLTEFMDSLDGTRLFFLKEDEVFVQERFASNLKPSYLYLGDLFPAFEIFNLYHDRVIARLDWINTRLDEPFNLEREDSYFPDRSELDWPTSSEEANALWEQRLTNELILERLEDEAMDRAVEKIRKRYKRMEKFLDEIEAHNVQETFLTSLAQLYDPHSNFFSWDSAQEFDIQISNALVGIGAQLRDVDGYCVIERLIPGGPAEMSGQFHPGDKIVAVAQGNLDPVDVVGMKLRKIVQMIRGEEGSEVRLTVQSSASGKRRVISLLREKVELTANLASAEIHDLPLGDDPEQTVRIGVIELPSFYGEGAFGENSISTSKDISELISKLKDRGVKGLVLDLRNNGGGRLDEAIKLTGLFIPEGPVVMKRNFNGSVEEDWDRESDIEWGGPLVVLVSRASASASEIVAGALQSHGRAVIVGDPSTHGKGTVQAPIPLQSQMRRLPFSEALEVGTVKVTVQQFYLPNGDSTQNRGVIADIPLPSANMFLLDGEADLDHALKWDHITPIEFKLPETGMEYFATVREDLMQSLASHSIKRQTALDEFAFLNESIEWYRVRHERESIPLNLEKRIVLKDELEEKREEFEDRRNKLSKELSYNVESVDLALTEKKEDAHQEKLATVPLPDGSSRANQFYQKVFYFQESEDSKIHEIWVEYFDYEEAIDSSTEFAGLFTNADLSISEEEMTDILTRLKNADRGSEFSITAPFETVLGERFNEEHIINQMPAFFTKMIEVDPDILLERSKLDIPLRESLRIVRDWIELDSPFSSVEEIAQKHEKSVNQPDPQETVTR